MRDIAKTLSEDINTNNGLIFEDHHEKGSDQYAEAKANAPEFVRKAIEEIPPENLKDRALLYQILGTGTPAYKMSKEAAEYIDKSETEDQTCGNCKSAYLRVANKHYICSQMRGEIKPEAWCKVWKPYKV